MRTWNFTDKTGWKPGPWMNEPDKVHWIHEGLDCLIVRGPSGALCGYVGVPPSHPCYGRGYDEISGKYDYESGEREEPIAEIRVHGGLTFSDKCQPRQETEAGICHPKTGAANEDVSWFGFDCAHMGDYCPKYSILEDKLPHLFKNVDHYWTIDDVKEETEKLAEQFARIQL